jgi:outer membrane protein TolC
MTPEEQSIHLVGRLAKLERELEQERQDRKQADLDALRALGERNDARAIIDATLKALPVGCIPAHTPESLPGRVADLVSELAAWHHEAKRLEAELAKFDETAIEWWCEYQDLKAKALEP